MEFASQGNAGPPQVSLPPSGGWSGGFAEHCSAPAERAGYAKPALPGNVLDVSRGLNGTIGPVHPPHPTRLALHPAPLPLRAWRYARLALHLAEGALTVALVFGFASPARRRSLRQAWSARMLRILGIRLEVLGEPIAPGSMVVANHISWVDIFVINAIAPAAFVSKAEVRGWPLVGWLAARNDTVFLRRGSRGHARIVNGEVAGILAAGGEVAVFPEGTTTDGSHVLHFHGALLQPALDAGHPVQPIALSYLGADGRRSLAPAYDGEVSLGQCLSAMIGERGLVARVQVTPVLPADAGTDRRALALLTRERIVTAVESMRG
jgi:1-acyl-sn-glycerol-3-phosphate acyltransferase